MVLILTAGLFVSIFVLSFLSFVPSGPYDVTPAMTVADLTQNRLDQYLTKDKTMILKILGKSRDEVIKSGIINGIVWALLAFLLVFLLGVKTKLLTVLFMILAFFGGIWFTQYSLKSSYRKWQTSLLVGIPELVNFMPAFLAIDGIITKDAFAQTIPLLPKLLKEELWEVMDKIERNSRVKEALEGFAKKANNSTVSAICFRLSAGWGVSIEPDIFDDLSDQIQDMNELIIARATTMKTLYFVLVCFLGFIGVILVLGYPALHFLFKILTEGMGV